MTPSRPPTPAIAEDEPLTPDWLLDEAAEIMRECAPTQFSLWEFLQELSPWTCGDALSTEGRACHEADHDPAHLLARLRFLRKLYNDPDFKDPHWAEVVLRWIEDTKDTLRGIGEEVPHG